MDCQKKREKQKREGYGEKGEEIATIEKRMM